MPSSANANRWQLIVAAAGAVLVAAGCGVVTPGDEAEQNEAAQDQGTEQTEENAGPGEPEGPAEPGQPGEPPNLDDVPDVVATVNGTEIGKGEFETIFNGQYQQMAMQSQMSGQQVDTEQLKSQTVESMVGTELLSQEADNRDIQASDDEVSAALTEFAQSNQMSEDEFVTTMGEQGLDEEGVNEEIRRQIRIESLLTEEYGEFTASEEEVQSAYDQAAQQQQQMGGGQGAPGGQGEMPPLEQVRPQVEQQVVAQQQTEAMEEMIGELRGGADVEIFV